MARLVRAGQRPAPPVLQAKLLVGAADDPLEREADRVADQVMRTWSSSAAPTPVTADHEEAGTARLRRTAARRYDPTSAFEADASVARRIAARRGGGQSLPVAVRTRMETSLHADLARVRIHRDAEAAELSAGLAARAFTHGSDIYFGSGAYDPASRSGQHLLAHELTHVVQQGGGGPVARSAVDAELQRKVGFEFEDATWHPWRVGRGAQTTVTPAPRKAKLHLGTGFRLEADDTPGPMMSNIEFVTEPFEESKAGLGQLLTALREMKEIMVRLAPEKGRKGPTGDGPPWPYDPFAYVTSSLHKLSGSSDVNKVNLLFSGGSTQGLFKMQATMGTTLSDLPLLMMTFGTLPADRESQELTDKRSKARALVGAPPYAKILGQAPVLAAKVLLRIRGEAGLTGTQSAALNDATKWKPLVGYLSVLMMYLKSLQVPQGVEGAKARTMFLARNKFSDLYGMLDPVIQSVLAINSGQFLKRHLLDVSNEHPLLAKVQGQLPDTNLTLGSPLVNPVMVPAGPHGAGRSQPQQLRVSSFTIGHWLESAGVGQDHLTQTAMALWLANNTALPANERTEASDEVFESFGEYPLDTSGAEALALFENRGILAGDRPFDEVAKVAANYLAFFVRFKAEGADASFPDVDISEGLR